MRSSLHSSVRALPVIALSLLLAACPKTTRPPPGPTEPTAPTGVPTEDLRGATVYEVSARDSSVQILVYRSGTLARLGHNHVMTAAALTGKVWVNPVLEKSGLALSFPVGQMVVDDPDARKAAGDDFPPEIPEVDRTGTRKNMLRQEVLDAEHFQNITLRSVKVSGTQAAPHIVTRITIKDASRDVEVPARVSVEGAKLTASGEFEIKQTDFGIKPFSVGLGTLSVKDELHVSFRVVALKK